MTPQALRRPVVFLREWYPALAHGMFQINEAAPIVVQRAVRSAGVDTDTEQMVTEVQWRILSLKKGG